VTKAELLAENVQLQRALDLARQDERDANAQLDALQRRHILVRFRRGWELTDAVLIPPSGGMSSPVTIDLIDQDETVEMVTEVIT